jgi:hypothetical protein
VKCDGCPVEGVFRGPQGERLTMPCVHSDCHLTPADFPIIKAMIAGEWKCETCDGIACCHQENNDVGPCVEWRPKENR